MCVSLDTLSSPLTLSAGMEEGGTELRGRREPLYLLAVASWRTGDALRARNYADEALRVAPSCHQSRTLRSACEQRLAEDALVGLMAGGVAVAGVAALVGVLASLGSRKR